MALAATNFLKSLSTFDSLFLRDATIGVSNYTVIIFIRISLLEVPNLQFPVDLVKAKGIKHIISDFVLTFLMYQILLRILQHCFSEKALSIFVTCLYTRKSRISFAQILCSYICKNILLEYEIKQAPLRAIHLVVEHDSISQVLILSKKAVFLFVYFCEIL